MNPEEALICKLSPTQRRDFVVLGIRAGKSNRTIAKELGVNEGTVRRDRKFLDTPTEERPVKKERSKKPRKIKPAYSPDDAATLEPHMRRILKALKVWIADEHMVLTEVEHVLHEAGRLLYQSEKFTQQFSVPTKSPAELILVACPDKSAWGDFIPNPDYWATWLARWLALCLPRQEQLQERILREASLWARSR